MLHEIEQFQKATTNVSKVLARIGSAGAGVGHLVPDLDESFHASTAKDEFL